jgi:hypothetical protein
MNGQPCLSSRAGKILSQVKVAEDKLSITWAVQVWVKADTSHSRLVLRYEVGQW